MPKNEVKYCAFLLHSETAAQQHCRNRLSATNKTSFCWLPNHNASIIYQPKKQSHHHGLSKPGFDICDSKPGSVTHEEKKFKRLMRRKGGVICAAPSEDEAWEDCTINIIPHNGACPEHGVKSCGGIDLESAKNPTLVVPINQPNTYTTRAFDSANDAIRTEKVVEMYIGAVNNVWNPCIIDEDHEDENHYWNSESCKEATKMLVRAAVSEAEAACEAEKIGDTASAKRLVKKVKRQNNKLFTIMYEAQEELGRLLSREWQAVGSGMF